MARTPMCGFQVVYIWTWHDTCICYLYINGPADPNKSTQNMITFSR